MNNRAMKTSGRAVWIILIWATFIAQVAVAGQGNGDTIVARVNGTTLFSNQLMQAVAAHQNRFKKFVKTPDIKQVSFRTQRDVLDKLINQILLAQASRSISIPDITTRVEEALAAKENQSHSAMQFARYLETKHMTRQDYARELENKIYMSEYLEQQGVTGAVIPESEIKEFYENGTGLQREESVGVRHILLKVKKDATPETKEAIHRQAIQLLTRIKKGEDFAEIAREYSECRRSNTKGGNLGYIKRGYMPRPFEDAAFSLPSGTVSEPIETEFGFHILQVLDKKEAGRIPYDEAREFLKKYLQERKMPQLLAQHVAELRAKADIEIYLDEKKPI
ncbi:MAG: peptidylprolyl isomerase [Desulfobulbaceae bacterium]|nr:peptidylprolyl isomerase [Desulfobulbaceae bacterium]